MNAESPAKHQYEQDDVLAIFDGQGTQWEGMGQDVWRRYAAAREVFSIASDAVGIDLKRVCFGDNSYQLADTRIAQPAIATVGLAKYRAYLESNKEPSVVTGLSMGMYPAVGISAISVQGQRNVPEVDHKIINLVSERAKIMHHVADGKNGRMLPVLGPHREDIEAVIEGTGAKIGVFLDKTVHTLTGQEHAVESAAEKLTSLKAKILGYLPIQQAAHHELQFETLPPMSDLLARSGIGDPQIEIAANGDYYLESSDEITKHLLEQMVEPADWHAAQQMMILNGIRKVIQFGADEKRGLARQMAKSGKDLGVREIIFPPTA